jgi:TM2 domain-containing membrane protein YozV
MAKTVTDTNAANEPVVEIDLKDPRLAAFLAWLVPGLGHIYQGRTGKGVLFFVCIIGTFFYGWYIGGERVVYASTANVFSMQFLQDRWQYVCQVGAGLPALPALVERQRVREGKAPLFGELMRPPRPAPSESKDRTDPNHVVQHPDELAKWNYDLGDFFEIGTVFTVIAGLLNILAIYDAYGGPLIIIPDDKKKQLATAQ